MKKVPNYKGSIVRDYDQLWSASYDAIVSSGLAKTPSQAHQLANRVIRNIHEKNY